MPDGQTEEHHGNSATFRSIERIARQKLKLKGISSNVIIEKPVALCLSICCLLFERPIMLIGEKRFAAYEIKIIILYHTQCRMYVVF